MGSGSTTKLQYNGISPLPTLQRPTGHNTKKITKFQNCDGGTDKQTYRPTQQGVESHVRD